MAFAWPAHGQRMSCAWHAHGLRRARDWPAHGPRAARAPGVGTPGRCGAPYLLQLAAESQKLLRRSLDCLARRSLRQAVLRPNPLGVRVDQSRSSATIKELYYHSLV